MPCAREGLKDIREPDLDKCDMPDHVLRMTRFVESAKQLRSSENLDKWYMAQEYLFTTWEICNVVARGGGGRLTSNESLRVKHFIAVMYSVFVNVVLISHTTGARRTGLRG